MWVQGPQAPAEELESEQLSIRSPFPTIPNLMKKAYSVLVTFLIHLFPRRRRNAMIHLKH